MLTKTDIKKLEEKFVTKEDLRKELGKFATKNDLTTTATDIVELINAFRQELKDDIVSFKDEVLHEILALRDEITMIQGRRDMLENHEQRITELENKSHKPN